MSPHLDSCLHQLEASDREFSAVGVVTSFVPTQVRSTLCDGRIGFDGLVAIPAAECSLGVPLFIATQRIEFLKAAAFGGYWDGSADGFVPRRSG